MPKQEMSWLDAVLKTLEEADEPMHYLDIAAKILGDGLRTTAGKTPSDTVAGIISRLRSGGRQDIVRSQPGYYYLRKDPEAHTAHEPEDVAAELDATDVQDNLAVAAYGLHWERGKVDWSKGRLYGWDGANPYPNPNNYDDFAIDFAGQQGVYLLHSWSGVVYVGRTAAESDGLFRRLARHNREPAWSAKWERFSWFGMRRVSESGELSDATDKASKEVVSALMESVLIETLRPAFNQRQGDFMGTLYRQLIDPSIARQQASLSLGYLISN